MIGLSGADIAYPIFALAALIVAVSMLTLVWRRAFQRMHAEIGRANVTLEAVNRAVNNVPKGTPPLPARLTAVEESLTKFAERLQSIEQRLAESTQQITINTGAPNAQES